ncbi:MAG: hypothetical protein HKN47_06845 [Pirellulaceae bacterium]|nr:hypothetical protein [Pirellulaceae bacterium]
MSALKFAGVFAALFVATVAALSLAAAIAVMVTSDARRAFSIGFLIPFAAYSSFHYWSDTSLDFHDEQALPTTSALEPLHDAINSRQYFDQNSGELLVDFESHPAKYADRPVGARDHPNRETFALTAHSLAALVCGILGGAFAVRIRDREQPDEP